MFSTLSQFDTVYICNQEVVANLSAEQSQCMPALWPSGIPTVLLPGRYLVDFESRRTLSNGPYDNYDHSRMELLHDKSLENQKVS